MKNTLPNLKPDVKTLEINNFSGSLTRINNGKIDSGFAKFSSSFGYDPFTKPGQLTWFETPIDQDPSGTTIQGLIVSAKTRVEGNSGFLYSLDHIGNLYKITPNGTLNNVNLTTTSIISGSTGATLSGYTYGSGMEFWGDGVSTSSVIAVGGDNGVEFINFDGSSRASVSGSSQSSIVSAVPRPLTQFAGNLYFGNGNNIGQITVGKVIGSYGQLSPALPPGIIVRDIEPTTDLNYLLVLGSYVPNSQLTATLGDRNLASSGDSYKFKWNGSDTGITTGIKYPSFAVTGLHSFLNSEFLTSVDSFGANIIDGTTKKVTLPNVRPAAVNANNANGNMFTFLCVEQMGTTLKASLFYYGQPDSDIKSGLWRLFSISSTQTNGWIESIPWQIVYSGQQPTTDNSSSVLATLTGKHIFSALDVSNGGGTSKYKLYVFPLPSTGTGTPQLGVYETQNQLFPKKISIQEIRVYTSTTVSGNGFQLDLIANDGTIITNGTFNYSYTAGTDITLLQGGLERINFNPNTRDIYSLAVRITNTGTKNMVINKIEIDYVQSGK